MKKNKIVLVIAGLLILFSSIGVIVFVQSNNTQKPTTTAVLEIFSQPVWTESNGTKQAAQNEETINVGEKIVTGATGRAQLLYPNHSVTRVDNSSEFALAAETDTPQQTDVTIDKGRIWSRVSKLTGQEQYQSKTGTVVATVRGTSYGHGILADGRNKITTAKHTVVVTCINNTQKGAVTTNKKFFLDCKHGSPSNIESLDQADLNDEWYRFNMYQDQVLDKRFGKDTYQDENGSTPQPSTKQSPTPTKKPTNVLSATVKPTNTQTPAKTNQPTATSVLPTSTQTPTKPTPTTPARTKPTPTNTPAPIIFRPPPRTIQLPTNTPAPIF